MTVVETAKGSPLTSEEKSILDRCIHTAYRNFQMTNGLDKEKLPTLTTLYNLLKSQNESEAKQLALILELYVLKIHRQNFLSELTHHTHYLGQLR
mgnify:CR=1 FL=1